MKKIFIALLALGSTAFGMPAEYANNGLSQIIAASGYTGVEEYTLTFNIEGASNDSRYMVLNMTGGNWQLVSQQGWYLGVSVGNAADPGGWNSEIGAVSGSASFNGMLTPDLAKSWLCDAKAAGAINGATVTLETTTPYDDNYLVSTLTIGKDGVNWITAYLDGAIDLRDVEFGVGVAEGGTVAVNGATYVIPEPTTATLSLLALAGLAARRRRK